MIRAMFLRGCLTSFKTLHACVITKHFYSGQFRVTGTFLAFWVFVYEGVGCKGANGVVEVCFCSVYLC
jgi:hypothetical protein